MFNGHDGAGIALDGLVDDPKTPTCDVSAWLQATGDSVYGQPNSSSTWNLAANASADMVLHGELCRLAWESSSGCSCSSGERRGGGEARAARDVGGTGRAWLD